MRKTKKPKLYIDHDFFCTQCGRKSIPVCRHGRLQEAGHLKKLYCMYCAKEVNHVECVAGTKYDEENFRIEYEMDNFTKEGVRRKPFTQLRAETYEVERDKSFDGKEYDITEWLAIFGIE